MTLSLVARTILAESINDEGSDPTPFGKTGCCLLPDGSYLVSVYGDAQVAGNDTWWCWKVGPSGGVVGMLTVDAGGDTDGRMHLIPLDGFLVQVLYMTGAFPGGISYVIDASGDDPVIVDQWSDSSNASGYGRNVGAIYLPGPGVSIVTHREGVTLYRRGRPLMTRTGDATGGSFGPFPHPTDPYKCAVWYETFDPDAEYKAWEITVTEDDALLVDDMGIAVPSATISWMVGGGNPYAATPVIMQEDDDGHLQVSLAGDPTTSVWSNPVAGEGDPDYLFGINADPLSVAVGEGVDRFAFMHELWWDAGPYATPTRPAFSIRAGIVDGAAVEQIDLEYGVVSPAGYPNDMYPVSLLTGSHSMHHRNGEMVLATCIVQQEGFPDDYYSVVSWKLTGGDLAPLNGLDGSWREGINNRTGRLNLLTSEGWLQEASEMTGLDAPARPAYLKTSQRWEVVGRFVDTAAADLSDPAPPETVTVTFEPDEINTDLAAAITLAGPSITVFGRTFGAFVAQASPPAAADLADASDATITTLVQADGVSSDVEVFTSRFVPATTPPVGGIPIGVALTVRGNAAAGDAVSYLDGMVTPGTSLNAIRSLSGFYDHNMAFNIGPTLVENSWGIWHQRFSNPDHPGYLRNPYTQGLNLATALGQTDDQTAQWWHDHLLDPAFYVAVQSAATNPAHGSLEIAELSFTIKYLIP